MRNQEELTTAASTRIWIIRLLINHKALVRMMRVTSGVSYFQTSVNVEVTKTDLGEELETPMLP